MNTPPRPRALKALVFQLLESKVLSRRWFQLSTCTPLRRGSRRPKQRLGTLVGWCKLDPGLKAPGRSKSDCEMDYSAFNLNLVVVIHFLDPINCAPTPWSSPQWHQQRRGLRGLVGTRNTLRPPTSAVQQRQPPPPSASAAPEPVEATNHSPTEPSVGSEPEAVVGEPEVGRCKFDPSLKATCSQPSNLRVHTVLST